MRRNWYSSYGKIKVKSNQLLTAITYFETKFFEVCGNSCFQNSS